MISQEFLNKNVTVIIRSVGERTTALCHELIKKQIAQDNIHIISEIPFTEAVRKTFEVGLRENRKWTFVIDADVLIFPGVIKELIRYAETTDEQLFELEGRIIDKFLFSPREAGNHLYRTSLIDKAFKYIPDPYKSIRPETHVKESMRLEGYPWRVLKIIIGLHDFEQYYLDIYRKCFIQSKKHFAQGLQLLAGWEIRKESDPDYFAAVQGFRDGCAYTGDIAIDADMNNRFIHKMEELGISEKKEALFSLEPYNGYFISANEYNEYKKTRRAKVVVYTAISGAFDDLKSHTFCTRDFDYVCYTDSNVDNPGFWEIRQLEDKNLDKNRNAKFYKLFPDELFPEYEYSIWLDGNISLITDEFEKRVHDLISSGILISAPVHYERNCIYREADECIRKKIDNPDLIVEQISYYRKEGFPAGFGLFEMNIIFRKHNEEIIKNLMRDWWSYILRYSRRDQLSFMFVLFSNNVECERLFPDSPRYRNGFMFNRHNEILYFYLYVDTGGGYNPDERILKKTVISGNGYFSVDFDISSFKTPLSVRLDPVEGKLCICRMESVKSDINKNFSIKSNNSGNSSRHDEFIGEDPSYIVEGDFTGLNLVKFEGYIHIFSEKETAKLILLSRNEAIHLQAGLDKVYSSYSWKFIQAFKWITKKTGLFYPLLLILKTLKVFKKANH